MTKLIVAFHSFANAPENHHFHTYVYMSCFNFDVKKSLFQSLVIQGPNNSIINKLGTATMRHN